eukprot:TRINITY_DN1756_c0_g1_i8.p1 TRINITY_DN1756_c0_g1~~TRINITY_DN1756_c0_g1_i8.p1  ORF type:complete len:451 (+),score=119.73 TRINITY_DN1756_c0_g1_i8:841-2193(+)
MARLFELLRRVNGFSCLRDTFELYVQAVGVAALQAVAKQAVNDPKLYVETILHVLNKYRDMVNGSLQGDPGFLEALQKGCRKFINENAVCAEALTPTKSPELLARYTDAILRKSARTPPENELERLLDDIMEIFTYVEDKDVFQTFYGKALAKRLIHGTSASEDLEGTMIGKLKGACGFEFTSKLQRMFGDVSVSKDKAEIFRKGDGKAVSFDFTPLVLATGAWPLQSPTTDFLAPADLHACAALFSTFYEREFAGRRLKWLHQLSKGELRGAGYASSKVGYVFQASLYQMGVLLLFNEHKQLSLADIQASTRLADAVLVNTIKVLMKTKVMTRVDAGEEINKDTTVCANNNFKSKRTRVLINIPVGDDTPATVKTIEEDRLLQIQAAIVRIMKMRKQLQHTQLVTETIAMVQNRFRPKIQSIKRSIDILIEKEYLERVADQKDVYSYIA